MPAQRPAAAALAQPLCPSSPNRRLLFVYLTRGGLWLVTDLGTEDLWRIGNTRRSQFTAHYLARPPRHLAFPSANVIHRRLLLPSSAIYSFFSPISPIYRQSRDFPSISLFFLFLAFSNSNFAILLFLFIFISIFSHFSGFYYCLVLFFFSSFLYISLKSSS